MNKNAPLLLLFILLFFSGKSQNPSSYADDFSVKTKTKKTNYGYIVIVTLTIKKENIGFLKIVHQHPFECQTEKNKNSQIVCKGGFISNEVDFENALISNKAKMTAHSVRKKKYVLKYSFYSEKVKENNKIEIKETISFVKNKERCSIENTIKVK